MNVRIWGGWLLVILGIGVIMTMGCEKGALGAKTSTVIGKVVIANRDETVPVNGATVNLNPVLSNKPNQTTTTTIDGKFVFEGAYPGDSNLYVTKGGYAPFTKAVFTNSGVLTDLGIVQLEVATQSQPVVGSITVKIVLRNASSADFLEESAGPVTITFNRTDITLPVSNWRSGLDLSGKAIELPAASGTFNVSVVAKPELYKFFSTTMASDRNIQQEISLTPVSLSPVGYTLLVRATNVPDYITGGVLNLYAEALPTSTASPPKVLSEVSLQNLGALSAPNLPVNLFVPNIDQPFQLRVNIRGDTDEVVQFFPKNFPAGTQGEIRFDVNFLLPFPGSTLNTFIYDPIVASQAYMLDNRLTTPVTLLVAGKDLLTGDRVRGYLWGSPTYDNGQTPLDPNNNQIVGNAPIRIRFPSVPIGYARDWLVTVSPTLPPGLASGSFSESPGTPPMISPPQDNPDNGIIIGVNAER